MAQLGHPGAPEYLTRGAGSVFINRANWAVADALPLLQAEGNANCALTPTDWQPEHRSFLARGSGCVAQLKLYYHPFWRFAVDGQPVAPTVSPSGLAEVQVPSGNHMVTAVFERPAAPIAAGVLVSLLGLLGILTASEAVVQTKIRLRPQRRRVTA